MSLDSSIALYLEAQKNLLSSQMEIYQKITREELMSKVMWNRVYVNINNGKAYLLNKKDLSRGNDENRSVMKAYVELVFYPMGIIWFIFFVNYFLSKYLLNKKYKEFFEEYPDVYYQTGLHIGKDGGVEGTKSPISF